MDYDSWRSAVLRRSASNCAASDNHCGLTVQEREKNFSVAVAESLADRQ
jgi:hypothetical protein